MFSPNFITTPGEVLEDYLESYNMKQSELAERTGLTSKTINHIIKAKAPITTETALKLEKVLGRPASFWNNLELIYQEDKARLNEQKELEKNIAWMKQIPISNMSKLGWIQKLKDPLEQLNEILTFFGIASPAQWEVMWNKHQVAYRKAEKTNSFAISAWLRQGEIEAQKIQCNSFNKKEFRLLLDDLRDLTIIEDPNEFITKLVESCANVGVAVVFLPELPGSGVHGCTKWIGDKAIIQLSLRYKSNDHLWFTFFHEAAHILKHGRKETFLEYGNGLDEEKEIEANKFSGDHLIPPKELEEFLVSWDKSLVQIKRFAKKINIAPGIVVGRLQHDGFLRPNMGNQLKIRYQWKA